MSISTDIPAVSLVADCLRSRRTIHAFKPLPVPEASLARALELACWAPNHRLTEPWRFYLPGTETAAALVALNTRLVATKAGAEQAEKKRQAWASVPQWLVVTCQNSSDATQAREDYAACACAIQNLMLVLWAEGIGVKWTTGPVTSAAEFHELMWIDADQETVVGLLMVGYPEELPETARKPWTACTVRLP